jgi:nicotinic acid mononucleotide adenylyltransferase
MAAAEAEAKPEYAVVNSYQGAFGPPTLGHYQAMLFAADAMLRDFPDGKILMLFMPTAAGGAKPHLALTQDERIDALTVYCNKLKEEINDPRIEFQASRIEYELYDKKADSATIRTLERLGVVYKTKICITMGLDNLFDLPFWSRVSEYPTYINTIYVPVRDISVEDKSKTKEVIINETKLRFNMFASWDKTSLTPLETKLQTVQPELAKLNFKMLGKPAPTSSSMLRYVLRMLNTDKPPKTKDELKTAFYKLTSINYDDDSAQPWKNMLKGAVLDNLAKDPSLLQELENGGFFVAASGGARSTPSNRMATAHHYESTVKGTMAWANSELEHVGRIAAVKDADLQYSYALSTVNGMAHLRDALMELASDRAYNHEYPEIARTHNQVVRVMKHLIREYKINLNTIRAFNTRKVLSDFSYLKSKGTRKGTQKSKKAKKSSKRRGTRRS